MSKRGGGRQPYSTHDQTSPAAGQSSNRSGGRGRGRDGGLGRGGGRSGPAAGGGGRGSVSGAVDSGLTPFSHRLPSSVPSTSTLPPHVSQPAPATISALSEQVEKKVTMEPAAPTPVQASSSATGPVAIVPPASFKASRLPLRPGFGTLGKKCVVRANHFLVQVADRELHHYDVSVTPEVTSRKVNRQLITQLTNMYRESHLGNRIPAYDGRKSLYTAGPLPFESKEFVIKLADKDGAASSSARQRRERQFKVAIKFASKPDLFTLQQFLRSKHMEAPQDIIQVLDVVLRASPSEKYTVVGRSLFSSKLGAGELGDGIEYWKGYYQSLRPTQMGLSLNIDISARAFYEPILVTEFLSKHFRTDLSRILPGPTHVKVKKVLRGLRVQLTHVGYTESLKITGLSNQPLSQLTFVGDKGIRISVVEYFRDKYKIPLRFTSLPAIQAGSDQKPIYFPMEICQICEGQRYTKKLNERQVTQLLRATCLRPQAREESIKQTVKDNTFSSDKRLNNEFGMTVASDLALVDARILPPPLLRYHEMGRESRVNPGFGQWNMINKKLVEGATVNFWTCVSFSLRVSQNLQYQFFEELVKMCNCKGMAFASAPIVPINFSDPWRLEKTLVNIHKQSKAAISRVQPGKNPDLQLLIVILPDLTGSYGAIKKLCETELGIVTQCCQPRNAAKLSKQYLENVALKINVKAGGRNTVLEAAIRRQIPLVTDVPTIIIGADVTHPQPGTDSSPSIAAVVASMDWPELTKYRGLVAAQTHREEIIEDLYTCQHEWVHGGMIRQLLINFLVKTKFKPQRIIFYRDGVSEGQFSQVLLYEMDAIRKACASLQADYQPRVTFVVVRKRHDIRLFPFDHSKRDQMDRSGNILPGTVVDTKICHPTEFDFYLNSHAGIQGTSRPSHYHVLYDENNFTADQLQSLTNNLCYTYARCTKAVSIVPPAYYARLAAFRARHYVQGDSLDGGSISAGARATGYATKVRPLPVVKDNVADVMFYC